MPQSAHSIEDQLMRRAARGDSTALERLYAITSPDLYAYLTRLSRHEDQARDLLQTTFLNAWRSRAQFTGKGVRQWLFVIARNAYLSVVRQPRPELDNAPEAAAPVTPGQAFQLLDLTDRLESALAKLPEDTREAIVLSRFSSLSIADIAQVIGASEGNVRVRIHRGLARLKVLLEE
ncbi:MAG: RNA polymerase sigma factor, partial [Pseudomonadota bacterium]